MEHQLTGSDNWREYISKGDFGEITVRNIYPNQEENRSLFITLKSNQGEINLTGWVTSRKLIVNYFNCPETVYTPGRVRAVLDHCFIAARACGATDITLHIERMYYFRKLDGPIKTAGFEKWPGKKVSCLYSAPVPKKKD